MRYAALLITSVLLFGCEKAPETKKDQSVSIKPVEIDPITAKDNLPTTESDLASLIADTVSAPDGITLGGSTSAVISKSTEGYILSDTTEDDRTYTIVQFLDIEANKDYSVTLNLRPYKNNPNFVAAMFSLHAGGDTSQSACYFNMSELVTDNEGYADVTCDVSALESADRAVLYIYPAMSDVDQGFQNDKTGSILVNSIAFSSAQ